MSAKTQHVWSEDDDVIGYYLYRFGDKDLPMSKKELADSLGMGWGSMGRKIGNFAALAGVGKLHQWSRQAEHVYNRYNNLPDDEFHTLGLEAIERELRGSLADISAKIAQVSAKK